MNLEAYARKNGKSGHNSRDYHCTLWAGDMAGGAMKEVCKVCRFHGAPSIPAPSGFRSWIMSKLFGRVGR